MKKNTLAYIERNEKEYKYYINRIKKPLILQLILVAIIGFQIFLIREAFLEREIWEAAERTVIVDMEVTEWVENLVQEKRWDWQLLCIIGIMLLIVAIIFMTNCIKSYELYKMSWLKYIPSLLIIILYVIIILSYYKQYDGEYIVFMLLVVIGQLPFILNFTTFLPLEIRESWEYNVVIKILSGVSEVIKKHM